MSNWEVVNHPSHYNLPGKKECIVEMEEKYGTGPTIIFCLMNAYKYLYRAGNKGDAEEDLEKARWYFNWVTNKVQEKDVYYFDTMNQMYADIKERLENYDTD